VNFTYLVANDREVDQQYDDYSNQGAEGLQVMNGVFEVAIWQSLLPNYGPNDTYVSLSQDPLIEQSEGSLGYAVRCKAWSAPEIARLEAKTRTFSNAHLKPSAGSRERAAPDPLFNAEWPGLAAIQTNVWADLSYVTPGILGTPGCLPTGIANAIDVTCNLCYGANLATNQRPIAVMAPYSYFDGFANVTEQADELRQPFIEPARLTLAIYMIFGETASAMMSGGPSNWTSEQLLSLEPVDDLKSDKVKWPVVIGLLSVWAAITALPQLMFLRRRWSSTLDGFEIFRFGAANEIVAQTKQFRSNDFMENEVLRRLPGMIGGLDPDKEAGFIGLSKSTAFPDRGYVHVRLRG
jgi:hypothetical protein